MKVAKKAGWDRMKRGSEDEKAAKFSRERT